VPHDRGVGRHFNNSCVRQPGQIIRILASFSYGRSNVGDRTAIEIVVAQDEEDRSLKPGLNLLQEANNVLSLSDVPADQDRVRSTVI